MFFFKLAWRNLWRYRRRSILAILSIAIGASVTILMYGMLDGSHTEAINEALRNMRAGHLVVTRDTTEWTLENSFTPDSQMMDRILKIPGVKAVAPHLMTQALISLGDKSFPVNVIGFVARYEESFAPMVDHIREGAQLSDTLRGIWIGQGLARALGADLDSLVILLGQDRYRSIAADLFPVVGIFRTGNPPLDQSTVFLRLQDLQAFLSMDQRVSDLSILVTEADRAHRWRKAIQQAVGDSLVVRTWKEVYPSLRQVMEMDSGGAWVIIFILIVIVGVEVFAALIMSVMERFREFGVLNALGMKGRQIFTMIATEALLLWALGMIFGNFLGFLMNFYFYRFPIEITGFGVREIFGFTFWITSTIRLRHHLLTSAILLIIILVAAIYPAIRAIRISPVEAMRDVR